MNTLVITALATSFLLFIGTIAEAQTARARIGDTPIREGPNLASAIIATLKEGAPVDVVDLQGDWYRVLVPNVQGKPAVGYVLAHLIELVNTDGSPQHAQPASPAARPVVQGPPIPPTLGQVRQQNDITAEREQALRAVVDALHAEINALQAGQPVRQIGLAQIRPPATQHPQPREGFWFNAGLGFGSAGCDGCFSRLNGASGGLSLGGTINEKLLIGIGSTGWVDGSSNSAGTLDARLRFYPALRSGFFLTGGLGLGTLNDGFETESGVGVVLGIGWDIRIRSNLSLTPFWNGFGVSTSDNTVGVGQLGLGMTIH